MSRHGDTYCFFGASARGTGCLRYLSAVPAKEGTYWYYEYAREDGSHELRLNVVEA